jgi:hypothetical protein
MTREQYIAMRNTGQIDASVLYTYAQSKGYTGPIDVLVMWLSMVNVQDIVNNLDQEFKVNTLWRKDGSFVKVVE